MDASGTKHPLTAVERFAGDALQHDGRRLNQPHLSCPFVDEAIDARADTENFAAERYELGIEVEAPVRQVRVQCRKDLVIGLHAHQITRLKIEISSRRELPNRDFSFFSRKRNAARHGLHVVVQPAGRPSPSIAEGQGCMVVEQVEETAPDLGQRPVA
jgi:hypothetical protein